jgi:hypothetical protein
MIIERNKNEVVFRLHGNIDVDILQDMTDFFEFMEISRRSKATQQDVDKLVKTIKKERWKKTRNKLDL